MLVLNAEAIRALAPTLQLIESLRVAFRDGAVASPRQVLKIREVGRANEQGSRHRRLQSYWIAYVAGCY
jgi:hypothetical protein